MAAGHDDNDEAQPDPALAPTRSSGGTETSPGAVVAPPPLAGDESRLRAGDMVSRYRIEGLVGRGGMGVVYRARDPDLDRALAIKLVRSSERGGDRMLREAQAMARLDHPNVVPIFDVGVRDRDVFLAMPFLPGGTLGEWCREEPRPWREVVARYIAAGRGLDAAHRAGIIHRDFKPENVLITSKGEVQVADFGLARAHREPRPDDERTGTEVGRSVLGHELTRAGDVLGTPAYMAPEQIDGKTVDARADQFSFCVALHEGLYGVRPFALPPGGGIVEQRAAIADGRVRPPPATRDAPTWLRDVILRGLGEDPDARWPSMNALIAELERGLMRASRRIPIVVVGTIVLASVITIGFGFLAMPSSSKPGAAPALPPRAADPRPLVPRQLTFRGDLVDGALAPDDSAVVARASGEIIIVPVAGGEPKILVRDASKVLSIAWAPDSRHVMTVSASDDRGPIVRLYDVSTGDFETIAVPTLPIATMVGPREIASAYPSERTVRITSFDLGAQAKRCTIPGDYNFITRLESAAGAIFVIALNADDTITVVRTDRSCTGPLTLVAHVKGEAVTVDHDGMGIGVLRTVDGKRVVEWTAVAGRSSLSAPLPDDFGAIAGRTSTGAIVGIRGSINWQLVRMSGEPARITEAIGAGSKDVTLDVSPDGRHLARLDSRAAAHPVLRVTATENIDALPEPVATDVRDFAWSPDGTRLAALIDRGSETMLAVVPASGGPIHEARLDPRPNADLVWLDNRRVAYQRNDNRTFVAFDVDRQATENLIDPSEGWAGHLAVNRVDGSLALMWNRIPTGQGIYVLRPGREPERLFEVDGVELPAWSPDGRTLWIVHPSGNQIDRYDMATKKKDTVFESQERGQAIAGVWPQADGSLLVQLNRVNIDLYVLE